MSETSTPIHLPTLHEHDFRSNIAVVGPLIQAVRRAVYNLTARWGVMAVIQQQNQVNAVIAQHLNEHAAQLRQYDAQLRQYEAQLAEYRAQLIEFDARLIEQDRDLTHLTRTMTELELATRPPER